MKFLGWIALLAASLLSAPAVAQVSDVESFVKAVRDRDGNKAVELLRARGAMVLNHRDSRGDTALLAAIANRDSIWVRFLLQEGAGPDVAARDGETPLIAAARLGYDDAVEALLENRAEVDGSNRLGETPLIVAVQRRHKSIVKKLLEAGADPNKADAAAGYSARDYARRDNRAQDILALIEANGTAKPRKSETKPLSMDEFKLD